MKSLSNKENQNHELAMRERRVTGVRASKLATLTKNL